MTAFIIGPKDVDKLKSAVQRVILKPIPWEKLKAGTNIRNQESDKITLDDVAGVPRVERDIENIILPFGWRVAISCEEQPAGILLHVSMSSPVKGKIPTDQAMIMVIEACGYVTEDIVRGWMEEFQPGHNAINVLIMLEPRSASDEKSG